MLLTDYVIALFLAASQTCFAQASSSSWQKYVRAPKTNVVSPAKILTTGGNVTGAESLIRSNGTAILTRPTSSDPAPYIVLDFGINIVGFLQIDFAGASNNTPGIRLAFSESTQFLTNVSDFTRSDNGDKITNGTDQLAVPAAPSNWTDTNGCLHGTQVCADGLHGFRYMWIALDALSQDAPYTSDNGTVSIAAIFMNFSAFLGTPDTFTGWFESSDETLNQYWFDAAYTNEMITDHFRANDVDPRDSASPTLEGKLVLFDGAKRDRDPYVGDIAVSGRTAYLTHNVSEAPRNVVADLADHQRSDGWIPPASINNYTLPLFDYPLWWVTTSWDYILYTGDLEYAKTYFSNLVSVLDNLYTSVTDEHGLLSKGLNNTASYGDYAFLPRSGEVTYYNALYVMALKNAADYATAIGQPAAAQRWSERSTEVSAAINKYLWDASAGAYLDVSNLTMGIRHPQDGNGIAVLSGVASLQRAQSALAYLANHTALPYGNAFMDNDSLIANGSTRVYAFISYFDIQARFLINEADSALEEIGRLYGWMADHDPYLTFWEGIGPNGTKYEEGYTSLAHGWSTGVLPALTNFLLGATPTGPGFSTYSVKPHPGSVSWARGQLATPHGPLHVSWSQGVQNGSFSLQLSAPNGTTGTVAVPGSKQSKVLLDKRAVFANGKGNGGHNASWANGYVTLSGVIAGSHNIEVSG